MTFAVFIVLILGLFIAILNFLPVATALPFAFLSSFGLVISYVWAWNFLLPIQEGLIAFGIVIGYELTVWVIHVLWRVVRFIRGSTDGG